MASQNEISGRQNEDHNIKLLAAQRQLYTEAKRWMTFRLIGAIILAIFPVAAFIIPEIKPGELHVAIFSVVVLFVFPLFIKSMEASKVSLAASIQEKFDTNVLEMPWNKALAKVPKESDINAANERFSGDRSKLKNWYAVPDKGLSPEQQALFCQQANLLWDRNQRKVYVRFFWALATVILLGPLIWSAFNEISVKEYIIQFLFPTTPLVWLCIENHNSHKRILESQNLKADELEEKLVNKEPVSKEMLRHTQDAIFNNRLEHAIIPNWLYNILRNRYETRMKNDAGKP